MAVVSVVYRMMALTPHTGTVIMMIRVPPVPVTMGPIRGPDIRYRVLTT